MFNPTREEVRLFFQETWRKHLGNMPISPLESMALDIVLAHPEYHGMLIEPDLAEGLEINPFLHMSLHLAVSEQLSINQPFGILSRYEKLLEKKGSRHEALHELMICLEEMLKSGKPDQAHYFDCLDRL